MPDAAPFTEVAPATVPVPPAPKKPHIPKNIVICCDGTGNEFNDANSNVVKLYTALIVDNEQVAYYHPGVGTMGDPGARNWVERKWSQLKGLAFGAGFEDRVLDAYRYLMEVYNDGDQVYLFGFSRGAYAARALAGLLHGYGLLCKGNEGHLLYAWRMYVDQHSDRDKHTIDPTKDPGNAFRETFSHKNFTLHFVGVWDTVSSVGWIRSPLRLFNVGENATILTGRHAVSIDERRCFFQDNLWGDPLPHQDLAQVWFAGVHSDVGGGYAQNEAALANITLKWMLDEAQAAGILLQEDRVNLIFGRPTLETYAAEPLYRTPAEYWPVHKSLHGPWWALEFLPHLAYAKEDAREVYRTPMSLPRTVPKGALVHKSVLDRMNAHPVYRPKNLLKDLLVQPAVNPLPTKMDLSQVYLYTAENGPTSSALARWSVILLVAAVELLLLAFVILVLRCVALWVGAEWMCHVSPCLAKGWSKAWPHLRSAYLAVKDHLPHRLRSCWAVSCKA